MLTYANRPRKGQVFAVNKAKGPTHKNHTSIMPLHAWPRLLRCGVYPKKKISIASNCGSTQASDAQLYERGLALYYGTHAGV